MRFLFFAAQYLPTAGGVERYTHSLARTLCQMGHQATVATSALPGLPAEETDEFGIRVVRLPSRLFMGGRFPVIRQNAAFRRLAARLWQQPYDFAVINTRFYPLSLWAARQCHRRQLPAVVLEHGTKHLSLEHPVLNAAAGAYEHAMMALVCRACPHFYGVSQACGQWLRHFGVAAEGTLYNAIDTAEMDAVMSRPPVDHRAALGLAPHAPLVAFVGRFITEKGVWQLLDAFALLRRQLPAAALVMAGDGPLWPAVCAKHPPGVHLPGTLPYLHSLALLAQANIFCLPTYSEGFSSTILEAAAAGSCIVTTPTGGSPELIEDGISGILLPDIAPATIAGALQRCLVQPGFARAAGQAVRQQVEARFTWQATAQALLQLAQTATFP